MKTTLKIGLSAFIFSLSPIALADNINDNAWVKQQLNSDVAQSMSAMKAELTVTNDKDATSTTLLANNTVTTESNERASVERDINDSVERIAE